LAERVASGGGIEGEAPDEVESVPRPHGGSGINGVELGDYDVDDAELLMDEAATNGELGIEFIAGKLSTYAMSM